MSGCHNIYKGHNNHLKIFRGEVVADLGDLPLLTLLLPYLLILFVLFFYLMAKSRTFRSLHVCITSLILIFSVWFLCTLLSLIFF